MLAETSSNDLQAALVQCSACRGQSRQQHTGGKQIGVEEKAAKGSGASSFNGVRAVPGVDGGTVYAAFLGRPASMACTASVCVFRPHTCAFRCLSEELLQREPELCCCLPVVLPAQSHYGWQFC